MKQSKMIAEKKMYREICEEILEAGLRERSQLQIRKLSGKELLNIDSNVSHKLLRNESSVSSSVKLPLPSPIYGQILYQGHGSNCTGDLSKC